MNAEYKNETGITHQNVCAWDNIHVKINTFDLEILVKVSF
jgi:hypothetical protein